ncbi:MAG: PIG-L family deacetylase [Actinomycetota bacterium]
MLTLVCFHAHPDDEAIATGGTMMKAAAAGHNVVLVMATRGEQGEPAQGVLNDGERLGERREREVRASAQILDVERIEFLPYEDSGMINEPANRNPACFWQADVEEAAGKLAAILIDVNADVLTIYDDHGGYGHPDHIQVHRVGHRAAEIAGVLRVFESTMNRDQIIEQIEYFRENDENGETADLELDVDTFGTPESQITHAVNVEAFSDRKRNAMKAHASQITEESFFLSMPDAIFSKAFGTEWYIAAGSIRSGDFLTDII